MTTATGHANAGGGFASPSGDIACDVFTRNDGANFATCDIRDHTYVAPPRPASCRLGGWGDRVNMVQGSAPGFSCHGDTNIVPGLPTLPYGQTRSDGPATCDSEPSGRTRTATGTGHYFRVSRRPTTSAENRRADAKGFAMNASFRPRATASVEG